MAARDRSPTRPARLVSEAWEVDDPAVGQELPRTGVEGEAIESEAFRHVRPGIVTRGPMGYDPPFLEAT